MCLINHPCAFFKFQFFSYKHNINNGQNQLIQLKEKLKKNQLNLFVGREIIKTMKK